jgi:hypothetical protein
MKRVTKALLCFPLFSFFIAACSKEQVVPDQKGPNFTRPEAFFGGSGNDSLSTSGGSSITLIGGAPNDSLGGSGGSGITLDCTGGATLSSTGGSSITM